MGESGIGGTRHTHDDARMSGVVIRPALAADADALCRFRLDLWPAGSEPEHSGELRAFFEGRSLEPLEILVAEDASGRVVGFCELSIRPHAEGCVSDRVAYLEGWYVAPEVRRRGVGSSLVAAAEGWGRQRGCTELASDAAVDNRVSVAAHRRSGFVEVGMIRCFRKPL